MVEPVTINVRFLARDLGLPQEQVQAVVLLLDDGFPVPFIARYRKDMTGNLDEGNIRLVEEELRIQRTLCERKQTILKTIDTQGKLTPELDKKIREARSLKRLEDIYLPFKPKKQTLAATARQRGLEPLALEILEGKIQPDQLDSRASEFINEDKKVASIADALLGAGHIIAEMFGEKIEVLQKVRDFVHRQSKVVTAKIEKKPEPGGAGEGQAKEKSAKSDTGKKEKGKEGESKPVEATAAPDTTFAEPETPVQTDAVTEVPVEAPESVTEPVSETTDSEPEQPEQAPEVPAETPAPEPAVESVAETTGPESEQPETVTVETSAPETTTVEPVAETNGPESEDAVIEVPVEIPDDKDSSGSGGGDSWSDEEEPSAPETPESAVEPSPEPAPAEQPEDATPTEPAPDVEPEPLETAKSEPGEQAPETEAVVETVEAETVPVEPKADPETAIAAQEQDDVQAVTETFQQWKEAREEQGIPTVKSQNTLRKKKRAEARKKKAEAKARQQAFFERQFSDYFDFTGNVHNMPAHRILAINRGERAKVLRVKLDCDHDKIFESTTEYCVPTDHPLADFMTGCLRDSLHRLVVPAMERELRGEMTEYAEKHAIRVFSRNLRNLLLQPPLYRKRVLALDPGIRHGCKMVPLDEFGNVLGFETVYLTGNAERKEKAIRKMADLVTRFGITVLAIGNGTGCRETEECVSKMIETHFADADVSYVIVNEAGASVYSASPAAQEEFPDYDVLLRGAVSIGRRLQDPLNELVKIEPGSLGVGMYQHDVKGKLLQNALKEVVESCVNFVGVDLNTATPAILRYISGINQLTARRIYEYRKEHGPFRCREDLKQVPGFGEAAFTHAAGFLKINDGSNPLDTTWIHPESYELATKILEKLGFTVEDLRSRDKLVELAGKIRQEKIGDLTARLAEELQAGPFTVRDILDNFARPDRDPRDAFQKPIFRKGILRMEDLQPGMELTGTILNVVDFGAFVDIGLHDSGLVHISQMADRYIRDAHDRVSVGDIVRVWVVEVDPKRKRISLTMLPPGTERHLRPDTHSDKPREQSDRPPRQDRPPRRDSGDKPPRKDGPRRDRQGDRRDDRPRRDRHDHRGRDRGPKTYVTPAKDKTIKPITEDMKKGKEPLRSFGDLAQLLGRVQVADPAEEKKRKKEEERKRREKENKSVDSKPIDASVPAPPPVEEPKPEPEQPKPDAAPEAESASETTES